MDNLTIACLSLLGFFAGLFVWSKILLLTLTFLCLGTRVKSLPAEAQIKAGLRTIVALIALWFALFGLFAIHQWHGSPLWMRCLFGAMGFAPIPSSIWTSIVFRRARTRGASRTASPRARPAQPAPVVRQPSTEEDRDDDW